MHSSTSYAYCSITAIEHTCYSVLTAFVRHGHDGCEAQAHEKPLWLGKVMLAYRQVDS